MTLRHLENLLDEVRRQDEERGALNHVWAYDFVALRTSDGRPVRLLTVVDEYTRECLAIQVGRSLRSSHVIECLGDIMVQRGVPDHVRSDNGPEFTAKAVRLWLQGLGAKSTARTHL